MSVDNDTAPKLTGAGLKIRYFGPGVNTGRMRLADFLVAARGLNIAIERAALTVMTDDGSEAPDVLIDANFQRASFDYQLWLTSIGASGLSAATVALLKSDTTQKAIEVFDRLFSLSGSVLELVKKSKGEKPSSTSQVFSVENGTQVIYNFERGSEPVIVSEDVARLFADEAIRSGLSSVVRPLYRDGVDGVDFQADNFEHPNTISKADAPSFAVPAKALPIGENTMRTMHRNLEVVKPAFAKDRRWRFIDRDGEFGEFGAIMHDTNFQNRVIRRELLFGSGDVLVVALTVRSYEFEKPDFFVRTVHQIIRPPDSPFQMNLL